MEEKYKDNGCNCNSRTTAVDAEIAEELPTQGEFCGCNHMMTKILEDKCNHSANEADRQMMRRILQENCGCQEEYAEDYNVDEYVADDVEMAADNAIENGDIIYRNTCDYYMVTPENHCTEEDDIFNYQGS